MDTDISLDDYCKDIQRYPLLSAEEERALAHAKNYNRLIECNLRLVVSIALKRQGEGVPVMDLIQEGNMGLMKAATRYDPDKGFRFSTYATWWIWQAVGRALGGAHTIHIPVYIVELVRKIKRTMRAIQAERGSEPSMEEIAALFEMSTYELVGLLQVEEEPISLDAPLSDDDEYYNLAGQLEDKQAISPAENAVADSRRATIEQALREALTARERRVIELRYGLSSAGGYTRTLEEIATEMGLTRERIRQIEVNALRHLREPIAMKRLREAV